MTVAMSPRPWVRTTAKPLNPLNPRNLGTWLVVHRWPLCLFLVALCLRLHWNLLVHPLEDYSFSDMGGYLRRADITLRKPLAPVGYYAFYPWGTHVMFSGILWLFGAENRPAIAVVLAVFGALIPALGFLVANRVTSRTIVPPAVGLALVFYYPLISLGGYALSEVPFCVSLLGLVYFVLRLVDEPRPRTAYAMGLVVSFGFVFRPQILLAVGLLGILWLVHWRRLKIGPMLLVRASLPLLVVIAFSSARLHFHTGRYGLISDNASFNQVFGRCHNKEIKAHSNPRGRGIIAFSPPSLLQLATRARTHPDSWIQLEPATRVKFAYRGYIGDPEIHAGLIYECVAATGFWGQVKYAITDVVLLFRYNVLWPDSGQRIWRRQAKRWGIWHRWFVLWPSLLGLLTPLRGARFLRHAIVALPVWSIVILAVVYFGSVRLRVPYDPLLFILAAEVYAGVAFGGAAWLLRRIHLRIPTLSSSLSPDPDPSTPDPDSPSPPSIRRGSAESPRPWPPRQTRAAGTG